MPLAVRDGAELFWECHGGDGPPLVLAAGLGGVGTYWEPNIPALRERFCVYTFDQRGTGRSSRCAVESVEQMSADLVAILDDAKLDRVHYLGHSTGGAIGVATALDYPQRLASLMVYASTTCGDAYRRRIFALRAALHKSMGAESYAAYTTLLLYPPYYINANHESLLAAEARAARDLGDPHVQQSRLNAILAFDRRDELRTITIPTAVVCADDDILTPSYFSRDYAARIPNAESHWFDRGGHALSRTEPDTFNALALAFFNAQR